MPIIFNILSVVLLMPCFQFYPHLLATAVFFCSSLGLWMMSISCGCCFRNIFSSHHPCHSTSPHFLPLCGWIMIYWLSKPHLTHQFIRLNCCCFGASTVVLWAFIFKVLFGKYVRNPFVCNCSIRITGCMETIYSRSLKTSSMVPTVCKGPHLPQLLCCCPFLELSLWLHSVASLESSLVGEETLWLQMRCTACEPELCTSSLYWIRQNKGQGRRLLAAVTRSISVSWESHSSALNTDTCFICKIWVLSPKHSWKVLAACGILTSVWVSVFLCLLVDEEFWQVHLECEQWCFLWSKKGQWCWREGTTVTKPPNVRVRTACVCRGNRQRD